MEETEVDVKKKVNKSPFADLSLKDILWPIISIVILVMLAIFVYFPFGMEIPTLSEENNNLSLKLQKYSSNLQKINSTNMDATKGIDTSLNVLLPAQFDVSAMALTVSSEAQKNGLRAEKVTSSDQPASGFSNSQEEESGIKGIRSISGVFSFRGELNNINKFLETIKSSKQVLVVDEINLSKVAVYDARGNYIRDEWSLDLTLNGYSFTPYEEFTVEEAVPTIPATFKVEDLQK